MYKCTECGAICKSVYDLLVAERNCPLEAAACPTAEVIEARLLTVVEMTPAARGGILREKVTA